MQKSPALELPARSRLVVMGGVFLLLLVIIGNALAYSITRTINVPWWDDWEALVPIAIRAVENTLRWEDLFFQHNQARPLTTRIVTALLAKINGWYGPHEVAFSLIGIGLAFLVAIRLAARGQPQNWFVLLLTAAFVFTLRQSHTLYIGFQSQWTWANFTMLASIWLLATVKHRWLGLILTIFVVIWGCVTNLPNFALWVLLLPLLFWFGWRKWYYYAVWGAAGSLTLALYLIDYQRGGFFVAQTTIPTVLDYLYYILLWLGAPVTPTESAIYIPLAAFAGGLVIIMVILNGVWLWRVPERRPYALIWLTVAAFVGAHAVLTSVGRVALAVDYGFQQPLSGRYITGSLWIWVAFIALAQATLGILHRKAALTRPEMAFTYANLAIFSASAGLLVSSIFYQWQWPPFVNQQHYACVRNFPIERRIDCLANIHPDWNNSRIHNKIGNLARLRLNTFIGWQPPAEVISADPLQAKLIAYRSPAFETVNHTDYLIGGQVQPVIYQAPNGLLEQWISVPEEMQRPVYEAAIWVDPNNPVQDAIFQLYVAPIGSDTRERVFQGRYDISQESAPRPFRVNLSAWRGQTIRLIYETTLTDPAKPTPWAMWVNPRIVTR